MAVGIEQLLELSISLLVLLVLSATFLRVHCLLGWRVDGSRIALKARSDTNTTLVLVLFELDRRCDALTSSAETWVIHRVIAMLGEDLMPQAGAVDDGSQRVSLSWALILLLRC